MERKRYVDVLRGIGIILVVFGHSDIPVVLKSLIYNFHMPLFFFLSGYVQKNDNKSIKSAFTYNIKKLIYPYFVIGLLVIIFNTLCDLFADHAFKINMLIKRIIALLYGNCIWENNYDYIGTLWFLVALFCVKMLYALILKIPGTYSGKIMVTVITVVGLLWRNIFQLGVRLPFSFDVSTICLLFFALGTSTIVHTNKEATIKRVIIFVLIFLSGNIIGYINCFISNIERTDIYGMCIGNPIMYYLSAMMIIISLKQLVRWFCEKAGNNIFTVFLDKSGQLSLLIMVFHLHIMGLVKYILYSICGLSLNPFTLAFITFLLSYIFSMFIEKYLPGIYQWGSVRPQK